MPDTDSNLDTQIAATITSSNGIGIDGEAFTIDADGNVLSATVNVIEFGYEIPTCFNTTEYVEFWGQLDKQIDILDIGYRVGSRYVPPEADFRLNAVKLQRELLLDSLKSTLYTLAMVIEDPENARSIQWVNDASDVQTAAKSLLSQCCTKVH